MSAMTETNRSWLNSKAAPWLVSVPSDGLDVRAPNGVSLALCNCILTRDELGEKEKIGRMG